jgi:hypothetical protein
LARLARIARSDQTRSVLEAWARSPDQGAAAFRAGHRDSGVEPPDTPVLAWGSIMGSDEAHALETVERALGDALAAGALAPGAPGWRARAAAITETALTRPLDVPPGQTLVGLVITERLGRWIDDARHPLDRQLRSSTANRLLHPVPPPADPAGAVAPMHWLLELAGGGGAELTQSNYLARTSVVAAVERFGWWRWSKPPRSEADVPQLATIREAATRLRLVRRRGRRLHVTTRGANLLAAPDRLWEQVSGETEAGDDFTRAVTELVGLRLLQGRVERGELAAEVLASLVAQGWSTSAGPISAGQASAAVWRPLRWWALFGALDEEEPRWERGTGRQLSPHAVALTPDGERMARAFLRSRATGPRHTIFRQ